MSAPLMALGLFTFGLNTAPFNELKRSTQERWESRNPVGTGPAYQHLGPGEDSITLDGVLMPELTGDAANLDKLRDMQADGKAWILVSGQGENLGKWFIQSVEETQSHFAGPGLARRISFTLKLTRYWDESSDRLGNLMDSMPENR
ncbi:phage tail protein [Telmatospirillum sp. J64-1]|uniref:phage tail protein n=1 Tax=Telmatospirillum sp. J64-1 TaxID=2502183 RepID=UPI00115F3FBE|nr:phage tail protein [Telmatospirillum sp. J64-1]